MNRHGIALIVIAGVLGVLSVLALTFITLAKLERRASEQRLLASKARLLARSGLEDALARLDGGQDPSGTDTAWVDDTRPSFFAKDGAGNPLQVSVDGRSRGWSGALAGDLGAVGNNYACRIEEDSGKINVNGGLLHGDLDSDGIGDWHDPDVRIHPTGSSDLATLRDTGLGWNFQLARILGILGNQPELSLPTLGTDVLVQRPEGGYASIQALQQALGTTKDLSPWLTIWSWTDTGVIHPNAYPDETVDGLTDQSLSAVKKGRNPLAPEPGGRPPVNLNSAPRPVLIALIQDLQARCWKTLQDAIADPYRLADEATIQNIADALIAARPFRSWSQFYAFCDTLQVNGILTGFDPARGADVKIGGGDLVVADLLKANFNPNTGSNKELPDQIAWKWIDKTDLHTWSTEGCFEPTGRFSIRVSARILGRGGRAAAQATAAASVEAFSLLRQTSQRDFAGTAPRGLETYLSRATAPFQSTSGRSASWKSWAEDAGLAVTTRPCPPTALPAKASLLDGSVTLATVDFPAENPGTGGSLLFLQHFDDGWDAEDLTPINPGNQRIRQYPGPSSCDEFLPPNDGLIAEDVWPPTLGSESNTLYPDGAHIQTGRAPAYPASGNFPPGSLSGNRGGLSYWVKTVFSYETPGTDFCLTHGPPGATQMLFVGRSSNQGNPWFISASTQEASSTSRWDRLLESPEARMLYSDIRWHLVTATFDTDQSPGNDVRIDVDINELDLNAARWWPATGADAWDALPDHTSGFGPPFGPGWNFLDASTLMALGGQPGTSGNSNGFELSGSNQVLDEFAVLDFEGPASAHLYRLAWARARFNDGRYYKGGDGAYLSPVLPGNIRLMKASWTEYQPRENRQNTAFGDGVGGGGLFPRPREPNRYLADAGGTARTWLELDLLRADGTLTTPMDGTDPAFLTPLSQGGAIGRSVQDFRYRVRFRNALQDPVEDPILESPVLDDVTFAWQPATGPRILSWGAP